MDFVENHSPLHIYFHFKENNIQIQQVIMQLISDRLFLKCFMIPVGIFAYQSLCLLQMLLYCIVTARLHMQLAMQLCIIYSYYLRVGFTNPNVTVTCIGNTINVKWNPVHEQYESLDEIIEEGELLQYCAVKIDCDSGYYKEVHTYHFYTFRITL